MKNHIRRGDKGQALIVMTVAMVGLLVAVGLAIDGGAVYTERRRMQNAADAAAKEGTRQLYDWQVKSDYADDEEGQRAILEAIHTIAERNGVPDTNGVPGDTENDNIVAYYVDSAGDRLSDVSDKPITYPDSGTLDVCREKKCKPEGEGRCCGVEVEVHTEFGTSLIGLVGPSEAPAEASATGAYFVADGTTGLGDYALLACGSGCGSQQMVFTADPFVVEGTAHSNDGVEITLDYPDIDQLTYVHSENVEINHEDDWYMGEQAEVDHVSTSGILTPTVYFKPYAIQNSDPNGPVHYIDGDFKSHEENLDLGGLWYVTGDVIIRGEGVDFSETTIVAEGQIEITTDAPEFSPWPDDMNPQGITLYSGYVPEDGNDRCVDGNPDEAGISITGDNDDGPAGTGIIYAPRSRIKMTADDGDWRGMVIGWSIHVPGDAWAFHAEAPPMGSLAELERIVLVR